MPSAAPCTALAPMPPDGGATMFAVAFIAWPDGVVGFSARYSLPAFTPTPAPAPPIASPGHIGALAFSQTSDPANGEFADAVLLRAFGTVPNDLSAL